MAKAKAKATRKPTPKKDWRVTFLEALADTGSVVRAARAAKVHRSTAYDHRETDTGFRDAWKEAERISVENMEAEARRRAVEGTLKPVFQGGKKVGEVREYSDTLLIFLLKAHDPKYRDKQQIEHSGGTTQTHIYLPQKDPPDGGASKPA
ncbi:MAG TPA: hypothetical protein VGE74_13050 [Gemmata sp.]